MSNVERAIAAYDALQRCFYQPAEKLYLETYPRQGANPYSYVWPFSQALAATLDMIELPSIGGRYRRDLSERWTGLEHYWNGESVPPAYDSYVRPPLGHGGDQFYDDNDWLGLELIRLHTRAGDRTALDRAQRTFELAVSGWDTDPSHPAPGGVFWTRGMWCRDRGTCSNAPSAELGLRLFEITGRRHYFDWAKKMYDWTNRHLLAPSGLYWNHVDLEGNVGETLWSYNQGTMIGASSLFYRVTGDTSYLNRGISIADAALGYYGTDGGYFAQPPSFNAIFFKNLLLLEAETKTTDGREAMRSYADRVWELVRDPATDLFAFEPDKPVELLNQAAMVELYASLARGQ